MSQYQATPFRPATPLLVSGTPQYLYGSYNDLTGPTLGNVISDSAVGTTGTLTFQVLSGNYPVVGSKITVVGSANAGGRFNVTNATIASVSIPAIPDQGTVTVTYTIAAFSQSTLSDGGQVAVPQPEVGEALVNGSSVSVASPFNNPVMQEGKSLTAVISFPTAPTSVTVKLQGADFDLDSEYVDIATLTTANTSATFQSGQGASGTIANVTILNFRFYRFNTSVLVGTGTIIGKIEI